VLTPAIHAFASPFLKQPPSLGYFMTQGSLGLCLVYGCFVAEQQNVWALILKKIGTLGEASLFVFFIQWYVYLIGIYSLREHVVASWAWPAYFLASIAFIAASGLMWTRYGCNRLLTVGYGRTWILGRPSTRASGLELRPS